MRITSKGQVTIPKEVRLRMGIGPGNEVGFREDGHVMIIEKVTTEQERNAGDDLVMALRAFGEKARAEGWTSGLTTDEVMEMSRGPFDDLKSR